MAHQLQVFPLTLPLEAFLLLPSVRRRGRRSPFLFILLPDRSLTVPILLERVNEDAPDRQYAPGHASSIHLIPKHDHTGHYDEDALDDVGHGVRNGRHVVQAQERHLVVSVVEQRR